MPSKRIMLPRMKWLARLYDCLCPRRCICCHEYLLEDEKEVCTSCVAQLPLFSCTSFEDNRVTRCVWDFTNCEKGMALMYFLREHPSHAIFINLKYHGRSDLAVQMGRLLASVHPSFFEDIDAIVPVPLHAKRLRKRGYNQAERIASGISALTGIPVVTDLLQRIRFTEKQTSLSALARIENVQSAFSAVGTAHNVLQDKHLLVVDDVITTGATISSAISSIRSVIPQVRVSVACIGVRTRE